MKIVRKSLRVMVFILFSLFPMYLVFGENNSISILPFLAEEGVSDSEADFLYNIFISNLDLSKYHVLEKDMLNEIMSQKSFSLNDFVEGDKLTDLEKIIKTEKLIFGVITKFENNFYAIIKLIKVSSGITEKSLYVEGKSKTELKEKISYIVQDLFPTNLEDTITNDKKQINFKSANVSRKSLDISALVLFAHNDIYAAGLSMGYIPIKNSLLNIGLWGGVITKRDATIYPQGGVRILLGNPESLLLTADIGFFPSIGLNYKNIHFSITPISLIHKDYDVFGATLGYYMNF